MSLILPDPPPAATPVLSFTEAQAFAALRALLLQVVPAGTPVIRGQDNRVPEPTEGDFLVVTPLIMSRLGTNDTGYFDDVFTGSIAAGVLTVSAIAKLDLGLSTGMLLLDGGWPTMNLLPGTIITGQLSGSLGGTGTYAVSPTQTVVAETMYAGSRVDLTQTDVTVQIDVHGPNSGNNVRIIESLFRSEYAVDLMGASGVEFVPLYCSDPHQAPFVNDSNQVEYRWSMDAHLQLSSTVRTPQQFATEVEIDLELANKQPTTWP